MPPFVSVTAIDAIFDSNGDPFGSAVAPVFGVTNDWEVIDITGPVSAATEQDVFWAPEVFDEIEVLYQGLVVGTDNRDINVQVSTDGSTFHAGATDYDWSIIIGELAGPGGIGDTSDSLTQVVRAAGTSTDEHGSLRVRFTNPSSTIKSKVWETYFVGIISDAAIAPTVGGGAFVGNTDALEGIRLTAESSATVAFDRRIVRGRRIIPQTIGGDDDWEVIDDTTGISAEANHEVFWGSGVFNEIEILIEGMQPATDNRDAILLVSLDGSTFEGAAADYSYLIRNNNTGGGTDTGGSESAAFTLFGIALGDQTDEFMDYTIHMRSVGAGRRTTWTSEGSGRIFDAGFSRQIGAGSYIAGTDEVLGIQISAESASNINIDRVRVRGRRVATSGVNLLNPWVPLSKKTVSSSTQWVTFTKTNEGLDPALYDAYRLSFMSVDSDTDGTLDFGIELSDDDGSTFHSTANDYERAGTDAAGDSSTIAALNSTTLALMNFGVTLDIGSANHVMSGHFILYDPSFAGDRYAEATVLHPEASGNFRSKRIGFVLTGEATTSPIDGLRIGMPSTERMLNGIFYLEGRRKQ